MRAYIGTSGFSYNHWWGPFYPESVKSAQALEYYCDFFDTVELNNTFYHLPKDETFKSWYQRTPEDFTLTMKASRYITHIKKLNDLQEPTQTFLAAVSLVQPKLGPILFQLPPGLFVSLEKLETLLQVAREYAGDTLRIALEVRNNSWICDDVFKLLSKYNAAFCIHDLHIVDCPDTATADYVYYRFHGPAEERYSGCYSQNRIKTAAQAISHHLDKKRDVYAYFNNDIAGYAVKNALMLKQLLKT